MLGNSITDTDIVALTATYAVVGATDRGKTKEIAIIGLFHQCRLITGRNQTCFVKSIRYIIICHFLEERIEGIRRQTCLRCRLSYQLSYFSQPFWCPVCLPCVDALLLHLQRNEYLTGMGIALHQS